MLRHGINGVSRLLPALLLIPLLLTGACTRPDDVLRPNKPPTVWLSGAPPEGSVENYTIRLFWGGWDPDGEIAYYEYCVTDNEGGAFDPADTTGEHNWGRVYSNDSTFSFSADLLAADGTDGQVAEFRRSHTFFIRSVDTEGLPSTKAAYRSFTARTLSPMVQIDQPLKNKLNPAKVPPISTFRWTAKDYAYDTTTEQEPEEVSWILEPVNDHDGDWFGTIDWIRDLPVESPEWGDWVWYGAPGDSGKSWTTPPMPLGPYVFAIRARDEAGAITPVFDEDENVRRILVSKQILGPKVVLRNKYLGSVTGMSMLTPVTIVDLPPGLPIVFDWDATSAFYGGTVVAYRYGWDIANLNDPEAWDVDWSPFTSWVDVDRQIARARSAPTDWWWGSHLFSLEVKDNSGYVTRVEIKLNVVEFTMTRNLLLIDDFVEGDHSGWTHPLSKGVLPNDDEHDQFWNEILADVDGFDPAIDVKEARGGQMISLYEFAEYKTVIWCVRGHVDQIRDYPLFHDLTLYRPKQTGSEGGGKVFPNLIAMFMAAGGKVLICGQHPVSLTVNKTYAPGLRYPVVFKYELDRLYSAQEVWPDLDGPAPADEAFAHADLCLESMDFAVTEYRRRRNEAVCPITNLRKVPPDGLRDHSMRAALPLDGDFPRLELRQETAGQGKAHEPSNRGLNVEVYNPAYFFESCGLVWGSRDCFEPVYGLDCFDTEEPVYGQPVAFWTGVHGFASQDPDDTRAIRSMVWGFPPVLFEPEQVKPAIEQILFGEWGLPGK
jgi:hypothetical protein